MEIIKLPPGQMAGEDTDCIKIDRAADGRYSLVASALVVCDDGEADSEAVVGSSTYATYEEAEAAGLAWASARCVDRIYVETGA